MRIITELYDKKLICPVCENEYTSKKVKSSKLRVEKRDTDLMTYYKGENPLLYSVVVCNKCGFSYLDAEYKGIKKESKKVILEKITSRLSNKNYMDTRTLEEGEETYKLALYCAELIDSKKIYLASLALRLGWIYRLKGDYENEYRFLKNALKLFIYSYEKENLSESYFDKKTVEYLIGELYNKTNDKENAIKWYNIVVSNNPGANMRVENLAREQWQLIKNSTK
ncbi:DUF2225 domain-containing protein [Clostridium sp. D2Q-11]|uniref:DUF2225 domain-containing protein n=1 Tax=Anaeromonas frigoriresistens TaxID=2683708 RepID=A0A942UTP4_9FIRM|nr:DUF2225 domain-containing protein [Anaeromonas frigoriresistens]MBS4537795.1 DUF2225 domain-containing protein [Anaeromonas frigoriresistens]